MPAYIRQRFAGVKTLFPFGVYQPEDLPPLKLGDPRVIKAIDLRDCINDVSARIWGWMMGLRDDERIAHPTRKGIARRFDFSEPSVKRGMAKLQRVGLVEFLGKLNRTVGGGETPLKVVRCYCWRVLGNVYGGEGIGQSIRLPSREVVSKILAAGEIGHGGWRPGAGRPRISRATGSPDKRATSKPGEGRGRKPAPMLALNQVEPPRARVNKVELPCSLRELQKPYHAPAGAGAREDGRGNIHPNPQPKSRPRRDSKKRRAMLAWEAACTVPKPKPVRDPDGIPIKPGKLAAWIMIPAPPLVPDLPDDQQVLHLIKAYRGAVKKLTGKPCYAYAKAKNLRKLKIFPTLLMAARGMASNGVSPIQWAMWRLEHRYHQDAKIMPITMVFSPDLIIKLAAFHREAIGVLAAVDKTPDLLVETHRIWEQMQGALRALEAQGPTTKAMRRMVADHYFPDGEWETRARSIKQITVMDQRHYNERVAAGEWLW